VEGEIGIIIEVTDDSVPQPLSRQLTGDIKTKEIVVTRVGPGDMFAWSALVPPHNATSGGKVLTPSRVVAFDCQKLRSIFEGDCQFSHIMLQKVTQVIRERLRAMRIESLSDLLTSTT
jgi:CRP-like cAMP-binding protein